MILTRSPFIFSGKSKKLFWVRQELTRGSNAVGSLPQMTLINCLFAPSMFGQCGLWIFHWSHGRSWKFYEVKSSQECLCVAIYANPWPRTFLVTNINNQIKQSNQITSKPIDSVTVFLYPFPLWCRTDRGTVLMKKWPVLQSYNITSG